METSRSGPITLISGRFDVGVAMAPSLIRAVRARLRPGIPAILDTPPGTSCLVIATLCGTDLVLLVTEPTPFGLHDLRLAVEMVRELGLPCVVVVNRVGIGDDRVHVYCSEEGIPIALEIPEDRRIAEVYSKGELIVEALPQCRELFRRLAQEIMTADRPVVADCDVDAADLHLLLSPEPKECHEFFSGRGAIIRHEDCIGCGACLAHCRFNAVRMVGKEAGEARFSIDPISCEGCGVCVRFCPVQAIDFPERRCGEWTVSETRYGPMVHAKLDAGAGNSGKLVSTVRQEARGVGTCRDPTCLTSPTFDAAGPHAPQSSVPTGWGRRSQEET